MFYLAARDATYIAQYCHSKLSDRMTLFPVRSNPRWRPSAILEYSKGHIFATAGFPIHFIFGYRVRFTGSADGTISGSIKPKMAAMI